MKIFRKIIAFISDLRIAIALLLIIAVSSGLGTSIPQNELSANYFELYSKKPWLGIFNAEMILRLEMDHIYTSSWFLSLLAWLGLSLIICSWRRQWPALKAALSWIDYKEPRQLSKLALAETQAIPEDELSLEKLALRLQQKGWQVKQKHLRLAARKGVIGRVGPPLVHFGLIVLMFGAVWGALNGQKVERFLAPGRSFELLDRNGINQLTLQLNEFGIERDSVGRPEQFRSKIELIEPGENAGNLQEISVNHPLRFKGLTVYQADWSLAAITLQIGKSPLLQLPLSNFPELGEQVWGLILPTSPDNSERVLLSLSNETGPIQIYGSNGELILNLRPGGPAGEINGLSIRVSEVLPASGLLLKRDPGVPLVYAGFALTLIGGGLSIIATRHLWAVADPKQSALHLGGLCNRNLSGLANELPSLFNQSKA